MLFGLLKKRGGALLAVTPPLVRFSKRLEADEILSTAISTGQMYGSTFCEHNTYSSVAAKLRRLFRYTYVVNIRQNDVISMSL